ncbi:MAG: tetratricopeptide repeat protein [Thermoguttaceae bacterium]|nr:tetratricopeptide repeat protein [Thermoguttaceae bacterium]
MSGYSLILGLWPGLSGLVRYGRGIFLVVAAGFGMLASATLFCCGFWTELIASASKPWLAGGVALAWLLLSLLSAALSTLFEGQLAYDEDGDRYLMALDAYLAADWSRAEKIARAILRRNKRDPDTLLLLATLYRRTGRFASASESLDRLIRLDSAEKWSREIAAERAALAGEALNEEDPFTDEVPETIPHPETVSSSCRDGEGGYERRKAAGE